jgi:hypothetical protein
MVQALRHMTIVLRAGFDNFGTIKHSPGFILVLHIQTELGVYCNITRGYMRIII